MADTPPKPRPSRTVKEGWAFKQGPPPWKNWKKRYLALNEAGIFYFKSAKKTKAELKGSIPLASIASISSGQEAKRKFCLKLETPGRNYMFSFDDERELKGWSDAIEKEKDKNKQGTLKKMRKRESASTTKLEELFIPPSPTSPPRQQEPAAVPVSQSNIESKQDAENRKAAMKEKRKLEREKKKSEKKAQKSASVQKKREEALAKKESKKKGTPKKEPEPAEAPSEEIFRTMLVHPFQESVGEFKEYLPDSEPKGFFPSKEELESLSRSKLKEVDKDIDRERDLQIKAIKTKYAAQKIEIIAILAEKEVIAIAERYGAERRAILEELKNRGVEG